jgi:hypothetical protein
MLLVTETPPPLAVTTAVAEAKGAVVDDFNVTVAAVWPAKLLGVSGSALQKAETPAGSRAVTLARRPAEAPKRLPYSAGDSHG